MKEARRKKERIPTIMIRDSGPEKRKRYIFGILKWEKIRKKKRRKKERKGRKRNEEGRKKAFRWTSTLCHFRWGKWSILVGTGT